MSARLGFIAILAQLIAKNNSLYSVEDTFDATEDKNYGADKTFARGDLNDSVVDRTLVAVDRPYTATE